MDANRWQDIEPILDHILDLATVERDAYLDDVCSHDPELRLEVEKLLDECMVADGLLDAETLDLAKDKALTRSFEESLIGRRFGAYETTEVLGRGGMGTVLAARRADGHFDQNVAIKVVSPRRLDPAAVERFRFERQILADLEHPSIAKLLDGGVSDEGMPFLVMDHIDGKPLDRHAREEGLGLEQRLNLLIQICDAIEHAHRRRVVHLDLKPSNILITAAGRPKVLDFGIAQMLDRRSGASASSSSGRMTPHFAAPEQLRGDVVTSQCDVYSLGVLLFLLAADQLPYQRGSRESVRDFIDRLSSEAAPRPSSVARSSRGQELDAVVGKALAREPKDRYGSPAELADDLRRLLDHRPVQAMPPSPLYWWRKHVRRRRGAWVAGLVAAAALVAVTLGWWQDRRDTQEKLRITRNFARQAEGIESFLRYAYALPAHDVRREKALSRQRMERIREQMETLGSAAEGPGRLALGRAELMLHRPEAARDHLEAAWDSGLQDSEVSFLLGSALGELYDAGRTTALEIRDPGLRQAEIERLRRELRDPALTLLAQVDDISEISSPSLVATMIALLEERNEDALELAATAETETPWLPEPLKFQGQAHLQIAQGHLQESAWDAALKSLGQAEQALDRAALLAPSDTSVADRLCDLHQLAIVPDRLTRKPQDQRRARQACADAEALDPELSHAKVQSARLRILAMQDPSRSLDERLSDLDEGIRIADEILQRDAEHADAATLLGTAYLTRAVYLSRAKGLDPREDLQRAADMLGRAVTSNPGLLPAHANRGTALAILAEEKLARGEDPDAAFEAAAESIQQALDRSPEHGVLLGNLANMLYNRGVYRLDRGLEAKSIFERALEINARSRSAGPGLPTGHNQRAAIMECLARIDLKRGLQPTEKLRIGRDALAEAKEINPEYAYAWINAAALGLVEARMALRTGEDPTSGLDTALAAAAEAERLATPVPEPLEINLAEARLLQARLELMNGEPAGLDVTALLGRFEATFPGSSGLRLRQAEAALLEARSSTSEVQASEALGRARLSMDELLKDRPDHLPGTLLSVETDLWRAAYGEAVDLTKLAETLGSLESLTEIDRGELAALQSLVSEPNAADFDGVLDGVADRLRRFELERLRVALSQARDGAAPGP